MIERVLAGGPAPDARSQQAVELVRRLASQGASRLDRDLDGKVDDPGAAVLDQVWDPLAQKVLEPVLGDLAAPGGPLGALVPSDDSPRTSNGSAYGEGWYGYVDKDLRSLLGEPVARPTAGATAAVGISRPAARRCGRVIQQGADALAASQGTDPAAWRTDATEERIGFVPGVLGETMRWANRPTLQQLMEFDGHR